MFYDHELIEEIRFQNDIIDVISNYIPLKQKGSSFFGLCPFHNENSPSFSVSADKQLFHCFGCGISGNVYSFIMQAENFDFLDAVKFLAARAHITLPDLKLSAKQNASYLLKQKLFEIHKKAARFFYDSLQSNKTALDYLDGRKISKKMQIKFGLGFSGSRSLYSFLSNMGYKDEELIESGLIIKSKKNNNYYDRFYNRLMFPIIDVFGNIIGFGGRIIGSGEPKYLNSPETIIFDKSKCLFGLNFARLSRKRIIVVEGYLDLIMLNQAGFSNVVATLGTAFSQFHARLIKKYTDEVVLLFDNDKAGEAATLRAIPILKSNGVKTYVLSIDNAKDPDEFIKKFGCESFEVLLVGAKSHIHFQIDCIRKRYNMHNTEQRVLFTTEVANILADISNAIEQEVFIQEISKYSNISVESIKKEIDKVSLNSDSTIKKEYINISQQSVISKKNDNNNDNILETKGTIDALKSLLFLIGTDHNIYMKVKNIIKPEDFILPIYKKLASILFDFHEKKINIYPAQIVSYFDDIEEQKNVTLIFKEQKIFDNIRDLERAVNDQIKMIKKSNINLKVQSSNELSVIQQLLLEKRTLDKLYISLLK